MWGALWIVGWVGMGDVEGEESAAGGWGRRWLVWCSGRVGGWPEVGWCVGVEGG